MRVGPDPLPGPYKKGNYDTRRRVQRWGATRDSECGHIHLQAKDCRQHQKLGQSPGRGPPLELLEGTNPPNTWIQISALQKQKKITLHCLKLPGLWSLVMAATGLQQSGWTGVAEEDGTVVPGLGGPQGSVGQASSSSAPARRSNTLPALASLCRELGSLPAAETPGARTLCLPHSPHSPAPGNPPASAPQRSWSPNCFEIHLQKDPPFEGLLPVPAPRIATWLLAQSCQEAVLPELAVSSQLPKSSGNILSLAP